MTGRKLSFSTGRQVEREPHTLLRGQRKDPDGRKLGRAPANAGKGAEIYKSLPEGRACPRLTAGRDSASA